MDDNFWTKSIGSVLIILSKFLIPRGTNYDHYSKLFGTNKTFETQTYDFLLNVGSSKERKQVNITIPSNDATNLSYTRLNFNEDFSNTFSGVTSLGEVFTIQTESRRYRAQHQKGVPS